MHDGARPVWLPGYNQPFASRGGPWPQGYSPVPSNDRVDREDQRRGAHEDVRYGAPEERCKELVAPAPPEAPTAPPVPQATVDLAIRKAEQQAAVFDTYAICSAILTGFSCSASYMGVSELEAEDMLLFVLTNLQQWLVRLCTAMGIYSVLIFTFCAMYARSCLARPGVLGLEIYTVYMRRTGTVRVRAFYIMYSMALLYAFSVVLSCWISFDHLKASVAGVSIILVLIVTVVDTRHIISVAGLIYAPDEVVHEALREMEEEEEEQRRQRDE
uniref:Transmembrane protein n=1 Tax=Alexandrium andersonii TaxID=327968 RepID=A0A7S2AG59_9DINO|mmetsp:Transcript_11444/g.26030  ORF Transcript_11444/g.26030 Transcript_11444/m.26030 type:complete len:272 (+) Transcript_11444:90-905(+)